MIEMEMEMESESEIGGGLKLHDGCKMGVITPFLFETAKSRIDMRVIIFFKLR